IILAIAGFIAIVAVVIAASIAKGQPRQLWELIGGVAFAFSCAASSFACLAVFLKFFEHRASVLDSLRDNSYGIYLFHYGLVNWLQYELLPRELPALAKFGIVFVGAAVSAWIISLVLRRIPPIARVV
ncbi:MAG: acyltransferase family protein, partial [Alphaproteobacteria bacterium]